MTVKRLTAWLGLAAAVTLVAGTGLLGAIPDKDDGGVRLSQYFGDHRGALVAASIVIAVTSALNVAFWLGLRRLTVNEDVGRVAGDVGVASVLLAFAMFAVGAAALQTGALLAGRQGGLEPAMASSLVLLFTAATNLGSAPTVLLGLAFALVLWRSDLLPRWFAPALAVAGAAHVLALLAVTDPGTMFSPGGAMPYIGPALYTMWVLVASITLLRRADRPHG